MKSHSVIIRTKSKKYPVYFRNNSLEEFKKVILNNKGKTLFLIDKNVNKKCSDLVRHILNFNDTPNHLIIDCKEKNKSFRTVKKILEYLLENKFDRESALVSIGGGVLGDITGFTASVFMRGIKYYQIPTSILSAVDSSVGGKTAVNFKNIKNLIGTFYQPDAVFINNDFFKTLPKREVISGIGELVKYAFLLSENYDFYLNEIKNIFFNNKVSESVIERSLRIKELIVRKDEKEKSGLRKILNFGHTFAHGFESATNFKLKHGEAVFCGIMAAILTSIRIGLLDEYFFHKFRQDFHFIPVNKLVKNLDIASVINYMKNDKKNISGQIRLVLPSENKIYIDIPVEESIIFKSLENFKEILEKNDI